MTDLNPSAPGAEDPAPSYLEQAAAELANAREQNEKRWERAAEFRAHGTDAAMLAAAELEAEAAAVSLELGWAFLAHAAIERGLPLCCGHHAPPEPEQEPQ